MLTYAYHAGEHDVNLMVLDLRCPLKRLYDKNPCMIILVHDNNEDVTVYWEF